MFFVAVLGVSMFCLHPYILGVSFIAATLYGAALRGWKHMGRLLGLFILPGIVIVALLNPTFNHNGVTLLYTMDNGNSITLESIVYGVALAATLTTATAWFVSVNAVLTRDKFVYAVGRIFPTAALILAMSFRFIPLFLRQFHSITVSQKYLGRDISSAKWWEKIKIALSVTSSLFTWSMENAIHVSDSMRARAYGRHRRTSYSPHHWDSRNVVLLVVTLLLSAFTVAAMTQGGLVAQYDPTIAISGITAVRANLWTWTGLAAFTVLCVLPLVLRFHDARQWAKHERQQKVAAGTGFSSDVGSSTVFNSTVPFYFARKAPRDVVDINA